MKDKKYLVSTSDVARFHLVSISHMGSGSLVSCPFPIRFRSFPVSTPVCGKRETRAVQAMNGAKTARSKLIAQTDNDQVRKGDCFKNETELISKK
jgi:hypothetical protein